MKKNTPTILIALMAFLMPFLNANAQIQEPPVPTLFEEETARSEVQEEFIYEGEPIDESALYLFYSPTCPHCHKEREFLRKVIEPKYPELVIKQYDVAKEESVVIMLELARRHDIESMLGGVPLTFIGDEHILGYGSDETTGAAIEQAIMFLLGDEGVVEVREGKRFEVPILGTIYADDFSLGALSVLLGFLDGFNVCSLGALILIIGLTLKLQNRRAIVLLGGTFIVTTSLVYGALIVLWAQLFAVLGAYVDYVKMLVALLALGGGLYFLKEYLRMMKQGAVCELQESKLINSMMQRTGKAFEDNTKLLSLIGSVLLFAAVIAIVEFPCSAATPLVFAGILSSSGISMMMQTVYIGVFVLFYMLDEIIIFAIAAYRLKLWMTSGTFTKYAVLTEAVILIGIGLLYVSPLAMPFLAPYLAAYMPGLF